MRVSTVAVGAVLFFLAFLVASDDRALAQDEAKPSTTGNPQVDVEDLKSMLQSLTKEELTTEADGWRDLLKGKVAEIGAAEVAGRKAEGDQKTQLGERANTLREERTRLIDRLNAVLDALTAKAGPDARADYDLYSKAVSGIPLDTSDVGGMATAIVNWLKSEEGGIRWAFNIVKFIVILIVFKILAGLVAGMTRKAMSTAKVKLSDLLRDFIVNTLRKVVFVIGLIIAISMLGVNIGPLLAAVGVVGFVIGFALQDTLSNFAAGFMILLCRPYDLGDVVTVGGVTGKVDSMSLVSTTMKTPDNQTVVVPNGSIWGGVITNITGNETRRVDMTFGIGYSDDISKAQGILEEIITGHELVLKDPEPVIKLHELADSSVNFVCRPWSKTADYWAVYWDVTRAVKERFDNEGISIPFPQRDIHVHNVAD